MKLLLSFVNSDLSLAGFDTHTGELFWSVPSEQMRAYGLCYQDQSLFVASDNFVRQLSTECCQTISLGGWHPSLAHSVHPVGHGAVGVVDTGNSCVRVLRTSGDEFHRYEPFAGWEPLPVDAVHLNDFAVTPWGIIASCFDVRPWRAAQQLMSDRQRWSAAGLGVLLNLSDADGCGRVVACGVNHPNSLTYRDEHLYHCSSATGTFHTWEMSHGGTLIEVDRIQVTQEHFLRGALPVEEGWYLGGSTSRHGKKLCDHAALYHLDERTGRFTSQPLPIPGEIYDILPWQAWVEHAVGSHLNDAYRPERNAHAANIHAV